jgi:hypothetical protein
MEQTTLKYLRVLIPGMISYLGFFPVAKFYLGKLYDIGSLDFAYVTIFSLVIGALYYQLNIQLLVIQFSRYFIGRNLLNKLTAIYGKPTNSHQRNFLKKNNKYMHVFYRLVDTDESLKKKATNVYFNGIFWTSSADLFLLSGLFCVMYKWVFVQVENALLFSKIFYILVVLSIYLHIFSLLKHINLSNDQLGFIEIYKKAEVKKDFDAILQQMPKPNNEERQ